MNKELGKSDHLYIRGLEIKGWLTLHGNDGCHFAIPDDMDDILPEQQSHFVCTNPEIGITEWDAAQIIMILKYLVDNPPKK